MHTGEDLNASQHILVAAVLLAAPNRHDELFWPASPNVGARVIGNAAANETVCGAQDAINLAPPHRQTHRS